MELQCGNKKGSGRTSEMTEGQILRGRIKWELDKYVLKKQGHLASTYAENLCFGCWIE